MLRRRVEIMFEVISEVMDEVDEPTLQHKLYEVLMHLGLMNLQLGDAQKQCKPRKSSRVERLQ